jgi:hypothetical protein
MGDWRYQGVSIVLYPGAKFGHDGPLASIRLKAMRRGLQDYEYLRLAEQVKGQSRRDLVALMDSMIATKGAGYAGLRRALFEFLAAGTSLKIQ